MALAHEIYSVYQKLVDSGLSEFALLSVSEEINEWGDSDRLDVGTFASETLDFYVQKLSEVMGQPAFYGGRVNKKSPKWFSYELMAVWDHAGSKKYIAWKNLDFHAQITIGIAK